MLEENEVLRFLQKLVRPKEVLRILFYSIVLTIAVHRISNEGIAYENLVTLSLTLTAIIFIATLLVVILWHFTVYENVILPAKDFITRKFHITNYRHWINDLAQSMNCKQVHAEAIYDMAF